MIKVNITYFAEHSDVSRSRRRRVLSGGQARLPAVLGRERVGGARGEELGLGLLPPVVVERVRSDQPNNYASSLINGLQRFKEAKALMRKTVPVARRILGESDEGTLKMRWTYARAIYADADATLDDLREAVMTLEDAGRIARRVLGGAHPTTTGIDDHLRTARTALRAREEGREFVLIANPRALSSIS